MEETNTNCCKLNNAPCWKFIIAAVISLGTTGFACALLFIDKFQNTALTSFATSTIAGNIAFWTDSPRYEKKKKQRQEL